MTYERPIKAKITTWFRKDPDEWVCGVTVDVPVELHGSYNYPAPTLDEAYRFALENIVEDVLEDLGLLDDTAGH